MAKPGPRPRPSLQVVREGNPGKRPIRQGVKVPPADLVEPDWSALFPSVRGNASLTGESTRCRNLARAEWRRVVPVLKVSAGLTAVDLTVLTDYCVCVARIDQCERRLSRDGLLLLGERGWQKNGASTVVGQYRQQLARYIGELGLSPSARGRITPPDGDDDGEEIFD
jgi:P27 family predicted phage terminase small subunit